MSKEKGEELFRAHYTIFDAVTDLNLRDLEAEAAADRGETSTQGASASSKGKAKVANPDWEDVPFHPVPITPASSRPRFSQVVGSSSKTPVVPSSPVSVAARAAMANAGQAGGAPVPPPPLAYATGAQFNALWDAAVTDQARAALEQEAITRSPLQDVQIAAMLKITLRLQAQVGQLAGQVTAAQAAAQAAGNVDRFRPAAPPKYGNKKQSRHVRQWTPMIEDYLHTAPARITSGWHPPTWRVALDPCGPLCMRRIRRLMVETSPLTLVKISVRRLRRIMDSRIWTRSSGKPGTF
jgi:hypothetical protein